MSRALLLSGATGLGAVGLLRLFRTDDKTMNRAFLFVHPGASSEAKFVKAKLKDEGLKITKHGEIDSSTINRKALLDKFNMAVAEKALFLNPSQILLTDEQRHLFERVFRISWENATGLDLVLNAREACVELGCSIAEMEEAWHDSQKKGQIVRLSPTFHCSYIEMPGVGPDLKRRPNLFVINGHYLPYRDAFLCSHDRMHYYEVQWDATKLSWASFNENIVGSLLSSMGKQAESDAGALYFPLHASASAFEGFANRSAWLGTRCRDDQYCRKLLGAGIKEGTVEYWLRSPEVMLPSGRRGTVFEALKGTDAVTGIEAALRLQASQAELSVA